MKRILLILAVTLLGVQSALAMAQPPQQLVEDTATKVLAKLKEDKAKIEKDPGHVYGLIDAYVLPHFDFQRMSRWVLGKYWRRASKDQRERFVEEFRTLLVRTYATSLTAYSDQKITYLPFRDAETAKEVTVRSEVEQPGGFPVPIDYRLHRLNGEWKVFDVKIDDISLVANYRTTFGQEIKSQGLDKLIAKLADRNQDAKK